MSEILHLTWDNVDCISGFIAEFHTKNNKVRKIPINSFLFMGWDGIGYMYKQTLRRAGIKGYWFRDLRHTFATRLNSRGATPPTVQELLGHNTLSMVMRYAHPTTDHKR
ncbi:MAG: tyrosine-type recombinase/integrase, partial [Candidatus Brocadiales bacterium]